MAKYSALLVILATLISNVYLEAPSTPVDTSRHLSIQEQHEDVTDVSQKNAYDRSKNYALPKNIRPENYKIELSPEFKKFGFTGQVKIFVNVIAETKEIVLHTRNLTDHKCTVYKGKDELKAGKIVLDTDVETLTIPLEAVLPKGAEEVTIECAFKGTMLHDDFKGFYLSKYQDGDETK